MLIGSLFLGKVHEVNGQWIETKFVVIGIPLFPTSSMLVTRSAWRSRNGFNIPLNYQSIIAGFARMFSLIIAFIAFIFFFIERDSTASMIGGAGLLLWLYFYFVFGSADTAEASGLGLNSTPSFVVNGRTVVGALPEDQFKQVIDEALTAQ